MDLLGTLSMDQTVKSGQPYPSTYILSSLPSCFSTYSTFLHLCPMNRHRFFETDYRLSLSISLSPPSHTPSLSGSFSFVHPSLSPSVFPSSTVPQSSPSSLFFPRPLSPSFHLYLVGRHRIFQTEVVPLRDLPQRADARQEHPLCCRLERAGLEQLIVFCAGH